MVRYWHSWRYMWNVVLVVGDTVLFRNQGLSERCVFTITDTGLPKVHERDLISLCYQLHRTQLCLRCSKTVACRFNRCPRELCLKSLYFCKYLRKNPLNWVVPSSMNLTSTLWESLVVSLSCIEVSNPIRYGIWSSEANVDRVIARHVSDVPWCISQIVMDQCRWHESFCILFEGVVKYVWVAHRISWDLARYVRFFLWKLCKCNT